MLKISVCRDIGQCQSLWDRYWPRECLFDLWDVRNCFAQHYNHPPEFYIAEDKGQTVGLLPLAWIEETGRYSIFPGELWQGKTWLEQNKIVSFAPGAVETLLAAVPRPMHARYLLADYAPPPAVSENNGLDPIPDETGYLFTPARYGYSFDAFMNTFTPRSRRKLARDRKPLEEQGISFRYDHFPDMDLLYEMNLSAFQEKSYYHDLRFLQGFQALAQYLKAQGMLRITTLLVGGKVAAVDMGAVWNSCCTVLAGGTNPEFPGAAKVINFRHLELACDNKYAQVDFLCGDFGWKSRFHLEPRPLYVIDTSAPEK